MAENSVSDEVKRFITDQIRSVAQLEILLLVRSRAPTEISPDEAARELAIDAQWAASELHRLAGRGFLLERPGSPAVYSFAPESKELERTIEAVDTAYKRQRVTLVELIFKKPTDVARAFADAFRFRRN